MSSKFSNYVIPLTVGVLLLPRCCCSDLLLRADELWVENSFSDFVDGHFDSSGHNLYASKDGWLRTIHRFDLNQDGYIDLAFNSTHDTSSFIPPTMAAVSPTGEILHSPLAVEGSRHVALADLNGDEHLDAVFCPNRGGAKLKGQFLTILWGGEDGWPPHRSNGALRVHNAQRIVVADVNADSWPDIAVLNGPAWRRDQPSGTIIRIYWGSKSGFLLPRHLDIGVDNAIDITAGDIDGDGASDLAVLTSSNCVELLWGKKTSVIPQGVARSQVAIPNPGGTCLTVGNLDEDETLELLIGTSQGVLTLIPGATGKTWRDAISVQAANASHVTVGDLDGDARSDIVLTDFSIHTESGGEASVAKQTAGQFLHILWGDQDGFSAQNSTQLPISHASATAIGDLNADGRADLAVAVYQGEETFTTDSAIFFGIGNRDFQRSHSKLETAGAIHVMIAPAKESVPARIVFCNSVSGKLQGQTPVQIYWGGSEGFDPNNVWNIPFASGYEAAAADLNYDGFVDLIEMNSGHSWGGGGEDPSRGASIYWGSADGFDIKDQRTVLREEGEPGTCNVADLNHDGFLDLVLGQFSASDRAETTELIVYYGGPEGFIRKNRKEIASPGRSLNTVIADFNQDGWLDVTTHYYKMDCVRFYWGGPDGFSPEQQTKLSVHSPVDVDTADLNADGYLDLIVGSYQDLPSGQDDLGTTIFWGSKRDFQAWNSQWLPGWTPIGHCVADFDDDGYLDLFSPHYHGNGTRESIPSYLFWGSKDGFAPRLRTPLICDSAHDALAADFDRDGKLDLAVVCHAKDGTHFTDSKVFYNDGHRFANPNVCRLPTHGPHWMWHEDIGHQYHRKWEQRYESSVFHMQRSASVGKLSFKAEVPPKTELTFAIRSAPEENQLHSKPWRQISYIDFAIHPDDCVLQYEATFISDNGDRYPSLDRVCIDLN